MKIAFASCMDITSQQNEDQPIWDQVGAEDPNYLFLLGDQIYMDFWPHLGEPAGWPDDKFRAEMASRYERQWNEPHFKPFVDRLRIHQDIDGGVYGTWDDHDFAWNNANGVDVPASKQAISRELFLKYTGGGAAPAERIYRSVALRGDGETVGKAIFLDTRSYREAPGDQNTLLGAEQLQFFADEMRHDLPLTIVCAGTPMRATGKGWLQYRAEHRAFMEIVGDRKVLFLSGDIHENAFLPPSSGTKLYEIISSGAAVTKLKFIGKRRNYGLIDWTPERTKVKLADKRGSVSYTIDNATFEHVEHEVD